MARFMLSPSIENFVEVSESEGVDWEIADVQVPDDSPLVSRLLKDTTFRESGIMLLGIRLSLLSAGQFTLVALPFVIAAIAAAC